MPTRTLAVPSTLVTIDRTSATPLSLQLYDGLREAILSGRLVPGVRLPSSRRMADELGLARNTVLDAYDQLLAEGFVQSRIGSGTYVADVLPDDARERRDRRPEAPSTPRGERRLSRFGQIAAGMAIQSPSQYPPRAFQPGLPDIDSFPSHIWRTLTARHWRESAREILRYGAPAGYPPLREAIAGYLSATRGVRCESGQVIVVSGTQQGLSLAVSVLLDPGQSAWVEDPGYPPVRFVLQAAGAQLVPVPVDAEGLNVDAGKARCNDARLVYLTPSHQFPLGVTLSAARRLALLEWAEKRNAWILEDDYDSEFRYSGRPLAPLQSLDRSGRVIYLGTFSKVLFPSLRLGFVIAPPDLVDAFEAAQRISHGPPPSINQAVLADLVFEGHFARHIRRMRGIYAQRQDALLAAVRDELPGQLDVRPSPAGMHIVGYLNPGVDDRLVSREARRREIVAPALSFFRLDPSNQPGGLVLGYAAIEPDNARKGLRQLADSIRAAESASSDREVVPSKK